jgi:ankyrin repeat protein
MRLTFVAGMLLSVVSLAAAAEDPALIDAAKRGDTPGVRALIARKADVNSVEADGTTALHWAVRRDNLDAAKALIAAGANARTTNRYGVGALSLAAVNGNAAMLELLLNAGADVNQALPEGETVLMTAARTGSVAAVKLLMAHGAAVNAKEEFLGQTALMWAVGQRHADAARTLIELGADVRVRSKGGYTPLLFAVRAGDLESVKVLQAAGANINDAIPDGTNALIIAIVNAQYDLAAYMLDHGANPNVDSPMGTALHALIRTRVPDFTTTADPQPAGAIDSLELAKQLLVHGSHPNARLTKEPRLTFFTSLLGATPFVLAARAVDVPMMRLLAASGADPLATTDVHLTPLMAAAGVGYNDAVSPGTEAQSLEAVKLALELGGDVKAISDIGDTALHGAALRGANSVVQLLVDKGGRLDVRNKAGHIPVDYADGVFLGTNIKAHAQTAQFIRRLMAEQSAGTTQH